MLGGEFRGALEVGEQNGNRLTLVRGGHQARYSSSDRVRRLSLLVACRRTRRAASTTAVHAVTQGTGARRHHGF
jgi:hypothetical protein